ncbi:hypothetical protein RRG08_047014 [Elysia crispata]|uniref:Uncharacterized protein n=1 Tax=Elysia crispata TaxID=231223 RepID=A0AAE1AWQ4_9GAST|nr:hypothetical protein RRG08_047014 [Elysia crispata]
MMTVRPGGQPYKDRGKLSEYVTSRGRGRGVVSGRQGRATDWELGSYQGEGTTQGRVLDPHHAQPLVTMSGQAALIMLYFTVLCATHMSPQHSSALQNTKHRQVCQRGHVLNTYNRDSMHGRQIKINLVDERRSARLRM